MNMAFSPDLCAVRAADLRCAAERARIAAFVEEHPDGTPFHLPEWGMATAAATGNTAFYLVAEDARGMMVGALPLTAIRSALFGRALVSSGFGVGGGILTTRGGIAEALAAEAWRSAQALGCPGVELRGGEAPGDGWSCEDDRYLGFVRPIAADDDAELLAIPRKQRAEVRRALGFDLTVETGANRAMLDEHYRVYAESVRNLGTPVFPRALFRAVADAFGARADVLTVRHRGQAVASVLSLYWRGTVYPYWGGGTAAARALRANDRMYFALMGHARERGCTRFDFGRSKAGTGAASFKKNWGFAPEPLQYHARAVDGGAGREINPLDPKYQRKIALWQRLPLPVANLIGPHISRGLG